MKSLTLLAFLFLAFVAFVQAGKVNINGKCIDCTHDRPTTTTRKTPTASRGRSPQTTKKPKASGRKAPSSSEEDGVWDLAQTSGGAQTIARRHRRQGGQYIDLGRGGGGWSGNGQVTTYDSRGYPGTLVRNSDCVVCNIRG
ncbi:uncharacterized protein BomBc2 [Drosophila bipectinata]|uniref:uncharacterized protein BomBc2 n=1 Tax=Drosophila bipectinata TaxID=42026 RepID=UPI001C88FCC6|nr:uncharacterized protein LOC108118733 [Drosophila bipectinata]